MCVAQAGAGAAPAAGGAQAATGAAGQTDYSAAWAEYYRQQAAYYGQNAQNPGQPGATQQGQQVHTHSLQCREICRDWFSLHKSVLLLCNQSCSVSIMCFQAQ